LTIRVAADGELFWNTGMDPAHQIDVKELRKFLVDKNKENPKLITLLKIDREGKYSMLIKVMDEIAIAQVTRFSLAPMSEYDKRQIQKARA